MKLPRRSSCVLALWVGAVILTGGVLTSFHQPFQTPSKKILSLLKTQGQGNWSAIHVLSGSCGCSQKVMLHLLNRHRFEGVTEQVLIVDDGSAYLPESDLLLRKLVLAGFPVTHVAAKDVPPDAELRGVPLLIFVSPMGRLDYRGGYGSHGDQDGNILQEVRSGKKPKLLAIFGCAVSDHLKRKADPFHLKYQ